MKNVKLWLLAIVFAAALTVGTSAYADNITVYDGDGPMGAGPAGEDQETEPWTVSGQKWDNEAFLWDYSTKPGYGNLSLITGFNVLGSINGITAGDLFLAFATDKPAESNAGADGNWGYPGVYDINWASAIPSVTGAADSWIVPYQIYDISGGAVLAKASAWVNNPESNPVAYVSGGTKVGATKFATVTKYSSDQALVDAFPFEFDGYTNTGGTHYAITFSGLQLPTGETTWFHFTQTCGNDNLIGTVDIPAVPEPASMTLLGLGLIGMVVRKFRIV